jgi:RES domain-containing protein
LRDEKNFNKRIMRLYRIAACEHIDDLMGTGAYLHGGRWNSKGIHMLYTAENSALSMLEALAHITMVNAKRAYCRIVLEWVGDRLVGHQPEGVGKNQERLQIQDDGRWVKEINIAQLPSDWRNSPGPDALREIGDAFVQEGKYLALKVPSVLASDSFNYLLNPRHELFKNLTVASVEEVSFDNRLDARK